MSNANRYLRSLRQSPKYELGMPARSAFKPVGGLAGGLSPPNFMRYSDNVLLCTAIEIDCCGKKYGAAAGIFYGAKL
jgi:hypothetical protein